MGLSKVICIRQCSNCGKDIEIRHKDRVDRKNIFCCKQCEGLFKKSLTKDNCICSYCDKGFHIKPSQKIDYHTNKQKQYLYCSRQCVSLHKKNIMCGENNHQYGIKGDKNSSWKSDIRISYYGYRLVRCENHPYKNIDGFVFEHRLIAEKYLLTDECTEVINDNKYLSPKYIVYHINFNRLDNSVSNLKIMLLSEHTTLHKKISNNENELKKYCKLNNLNYEDVCLYRKTLKIRNGGFGSSGK